MEKLLLTKNGLRAWRWDGDLRGQHKIKKTDQGFIVTNKADDAVIAVYPTREEADSRYYKEAEIDLVWPLLRETIEIEPDVTVADINRLVYDNADLLFFCEQVFQIHNYTTAFNGGVIHRIGEISDGELRLDYSLEMIDDTPVVDSGIFTIYKPNGEVLCKGEYHLSLLEVLEAIYGHNPGKVSLSKNGLVREDGVANPFEMLLAPVTVEDGVTIQDVFNLVGDNDDLKNFISCYSWCEKLDEFHKEAKVEAPDDDEMEPLISTEVYRQIKFDLACRYRPNDSLDVFTDFHALGQVSNSTKEFYTQRGETPPETEYYSISGSPANRYANIPLVAQETTEIHQDAVFSRQGNVKQEARMLAKVRCPLTLLELLDGIYWDISFYGGPEKRDEFMQELTDRADEVRSGEAKTMPIEELFKELEEE